MDADAAAPNGGGGPDLLREHSIAVTRAGHAGPPAFRRLEQAVGCELARLLVVALAGRRGARLVV